MPQRVFGEFNLWWHHRQFDICGCHRNSPGEIHRRRCCPPSSKNDDRLNSFYRPPKVLLAKIAATVSKAVHLVQTRSVVLGCSSITFQLTISHLVRVLSSNHAILMPYNLRYIYDNILTTCYRKRNVFIVEELCVYAQVVVSEIPE